MGKGWVSMKTREEVEVELKRLNNEIIKIDSLFAETDSPELQIKFIHEIKEIIGKKESLLWVLK